LIPGDPEREQEQIRRAKGIPLIEAVADDLRSVARRTGVPLA
jgi:LDH2 family malate/lactate/ureidoglycolate dehydrogenase